MSDDVHLNEHYEKIAGLIGNVLLEFNELELDAGRVLARLLKQDDLVARILAGSLMFSHKLTLIKELAALKVQEPVLKERFKMALKRAESVNAERNRYIHSEIVPLFGNDDKLLSLKTRSMKKGATSEYQNISAASVKKLVGELQALGLELRQCAELFHEQFGILAQE